MMFKYVLKDNVIVITLALVVLFLSVFANNFLTIGNAKNVAINSAILSVVVVPGTLLIVSGYIDLSVGSVTGFSGVLTALAASKWGWSAPASMFVGLVSGAGIGAAN